jgi:hypothetical protein
MMVSMFEQMSAFSFSILPAMFFGVDVVDEFQYAFLEIEILFMIGCVLGPLSGISVFASDEKCDWNCLFMILAFSVGSACKTPSLLRGAILVFSGLLCRSIHFWVAY